MPAILSIELTREPLDVARAAAAVSHADIGGIDIFLGTTRAETGTPEQGPLVALEYHAYDEMALKELRKLGEAACARWPVQRAVIWHRLGRVAVGEASVLIAVGCPHRGEAFEACRFIIDELKVAVPIWKKELYAHDSRWQGD